MDKVQALADYFIWIEPDWNVKVIMYGTNAAPTTIWIEPDWNVKAYPLSLLIQISSFE